MNDREQLNKIEGKVDKLDEKLDKVNEVLVRNTQSLEYHIKRTDLLEQSQKDTAASLKQVQEHVTTVKTIFKVVCWLGGLTVGILGLLKLLNDLGVL